MIAATAFGRAMAGSMENSDDYRKQLVALAAPRWEQAAADLAENTLEFVRDRYGDDGDLAFVPVRYRVSSYANDEAEVQLWGVTVAHGSKVGGIEESWVTGTIRLAWIQGDWLVIGQESAAGPTPELLRATDDVSSETLLEGFKEFQHGPQS